MIRLGIGIIVPMISIPGFEDKNYRTGPCKSPTPFCLDEIVDTWPQVGVCTAARRSYRARVAAGGSVLSSFFSSLFVFREGSAYAARTGQWIHG